MRRSSAGGEISSTAGRTRSGRDRSPAPAGCRLNDQTSRRRRRLEPGRALGPDAVEDHLRVALPQVLIQPRQRVAKRRRRGHQQEREILGLEVGARRARFLGALEDHADEVERLRPQLLERGVRHAAVAGRLEEALIGLQLLGDRLGEEALEPARRIGVGGEPRHRLDRGAHLALEDRVDELLLGREAAKQRRLADAGGLRDLRGRDVEPALGEDLRRGLEDAVAVARGVGAQRGCDRTLLDRGDARECSSVADGARREEQRLLRCPGRSSRASSRPRRPRLGASGTRGTASPASIRATSLRRSSVATIAVPATNRPAAT